MKTRFLFLLVFISSYSFSQSVNDFKAVIVPLKYDFLKNENDYRLNTLTKFNLTNAGFVAFYTSETIPAEYSDRCSVLYLDVKKENAFLTTKLYITFSNCNGSLVFQSPIGKSKEKDFEKAYSEALNEAFKSVNDLRYKYNGAKDDATAKAVAVSPAAAVVEATVINPANPDLLFAQPIQNGFQLVDNTPKVVMKVLNTSKKDCFIAFRGTVQGLLIAKDTNWFFEYYQNDKLISERVEVKF